MYIKGNCRDQQTLLKMTISDLSFLEGGGSKLLFPLSRCKHSFIRYQSLSLAIMPFWLKTLGYINPTHPQPLGRKGFTGPEEGACGPAAFHE